MHSRYRHREKCRRQQSAQDRALATGCAFQDAVHEVDDQDGVGSLDQANDQQLEARIVNPDGPRDDHDRSDDPGKERRARVRRGQSRAAGDLIGGVDDDVVVVAGEESLTEDGCEQAQQRRDDEDALQRPVYLSSPC